MSTSTGAVASTATFRKAKLSETSVLLLVAWCVPFCVHLVPWSGARPLGAYLLPMFWVTLVAAYFFGARLGALVGLFAPAVNLLVTGLPAWKFLAGMSGELVVFACLVAWGMRWRPGFLFTAPLAYLGARLVMAPIEAVIAPSDHVLDSLIRSLGTGVVGLVILAAIQVALVWFYPRPRLTARE